MEDLNDWQLKFQSCSYSERLLNKLLLLNERADNKIDLLEVKKAIYYARKYHGNQKRDSGEPYYSHPIEVAYMVAECAIDTIPQFFTTDVIVTSILHDTIEDTALTKDMVKVVFGELIANQVESLSKNKVDKKLSLEELIELLYKQQNDNLLLIKIFDRIHNLQTLNYRTLVKQRMMKEETLTNLVPVAKYLGLSSLEDKLVELCNEFVEE
ncbi:MAG: HD domain-containing protein [Candidatus Rickettsia vulgarisii]